MDFGGDRKWGFEAGGRGYLCCLMWLVGVESDWAYWTKEERENGEWEVIH